MQHVADTATAMSVIPFPGGAVERPNPLSLADKLQILVLTRPAAAKEVEKLIDRLLIKPAM